jgi:uncharacterized membrane protein
VKIFPPYAMLRKLTDRMVGVETNEHLKPALIQVNQVWQVGFIIDAFEQNYSTVFMPSAPDPSSGVVQIVSSAHIAPIAASRQDVLSCLKRTGCGLPTLLANSSFNK